MVRTSSTKSTIPRERADLADFLATLTPSEWQSPSLCYKWNVKDVVAHVVSYEHLTKLGLVKRFLKGGIVRTNEVLGAK